MRFGEKVQEVLRRQLVPFDYVFIWAMFVFVACGGDSGSKSPVIPEVEPEQDHETTWTTHYSGYVPDMDPNDLEQRLWMRILRTAAVHCKRDLRLRDTARAYGRLLAMSGTEVRHGDISQVRFLLAQNGSTDYLIQPFVSNLNESSLAFLIKLIEENSREWTHCGIGVYPHGESGRGVFIGVRRLVTVDSFPVSVPVHSHSVMRGHVERNMGRKIQPFLGQPDGQVVRLPQAPVFQDGTFEIKFFFPRKGRYEIELLVDGERGAETAVLVPVFAGTEPDALPTVVVEPDGGAEDGGHAEALFRYLTQFRSRRGLPPLRRDSRLDAIAKSHSEEMANRGFFGHVSPAFGTLLKRLERHGLRPRRSAENVARSRTTYRIHRNLMGSPSHRINALDSAFTHVGIGVASDGSDVVATQVFVRY